VGPDGCAGHARPLLRPARLSQLDRRPHRGHAVCLIGANSSNGQVAILDPWNAAENRTGFKLYTVAEFNDFFKWDDANSKKYSLMYKKQKGVLGAIGTILGKQRKVWKDYLAA
jgi:hypothetical protein